LDHPRIFPAVFLFPRQEFSHHAGIFPVISPYLFFIPGRLLSPRPTDGRDPGLSDEKNAVDVKKILSYVMEFSNRELKMFPFFTVHVHLRA
jgi:hypothetical protein